MQSYLFVLLKNKGFVFFPFRDLISSIQQQVGEGDRVVYFRNRDQDLDLPKMSQ